MKSKIVLCVMSILVIASNALGQTTKKESTILGEVVDIKSYIVFGMKADNADRKTAVEASMNAGNPLGILEKSTGKIYVVTMAQLTENANSKLKDYLGVRVYAKGLVYKRGGSQLLVLSDIGKTIK